MDESQKATKAILEEDLQGPNNQDGKGATPEKTGGNTSVLQDILRLILKILVIVLVFMLLFTFLFGATRLKSTAMDPNMKEGDLIIYYRLDKSYVATNCVAFRYNGQTQVMRVVAVAGDTVDMTEDGLVINGALQSEPDPTKDTFPFKQGVAFPVKLGGGEVFLMGDNRPESIDSRVFGPVKAKDTLGELMTVVRSEA